VGSQREEIGEKVFGSFEEYFPHYVSQHSRPATRWLHFAGAHLGAVAAAAALVRRQPAGILALPLIGYWVARGSHRAVEKNRPATFAHPLWSVRGDLRMIAMMWQGRDDELTRIARDQGTIVLDGGEPDSA
jgi:hypothetical protein